MVVWKRERTYTPPQVLHLVQSACEGARSVQEVQEKVATALQPRLITLKDASEKYGISYQCLSKWVQRGHLSVRDRRKGPGRGGTVLVDESEVAYLKLNPPKPTGRPRKNMSKTP